MQPFAEHGTMSVDTKLEYVLSITDADHPLPRAFTAATTVEIVVYVAKRQSHQPYHP